MGRDRRGGPRRGGPRRGRKGGRDGGAKRRAGRRAERPARGARARRPAPARSDELVAGEVVKRSADGRCRVKADVGGVWDAASPFTVRVGDRVLVLPVAGPRGRVGEILHVLEGARDRWVGVFRRRGRAGDVTPYRDDAEWRVGIAPEDAGDARDGDVVVVLPVRRRGRERRGETARGRVVEVLGPPGTPEADFRAVVWRHRLPVVFPDEALREAAEAPAGIPEDELARRIDLRDRPFVTIDPVTARDFDDAVHVEEGGERARLFVAIADVSHYVRAGGALDREAQRRGNSVYFPDRAIPMLPERLSGDVCSLRPDEERLVMVVELALDARARVARRHFYPAVIRSRARLVYEDAARAMEGGPAPDSVVGDQLAALARWTERLSRRRHAEGSLDFDLPSAEIVLGDEGHPVDVVSAPRTRAHRAVEEAMLAANRAVAAALAAADVPALHRNHDPPAADDLEKLRELLGGLGLLDSASGELDGRALGRVLERAEGTPTERLVNTAVLRSMRLARYGAHPRGHFALAFSHYTHFTSPIRRYADLAVHRALKGLLEGAPGGLDVAAAARLAGRLSFRERLAERAERERVDLAKCDFMASRVGETYTGVVSGVARHGLYVTLDPFFVEGLVHVSRLPDYVDLDERGFALVARRSGVRYRVGDPVRVRVEAVDRIRAHVDFELLEHRRAAPPRDHRAARRRSRSDSSL